MIMSDARVRVAPPARARRVFDNPAEMGCSEPREVEPDPEIFVGARRRNVAWLRLCSVLAAICPAFMALVIGEVLQSEK